MGLCKGVALTLQGVELLEDFIPMELRSTDVILGVKWLRTLGGIYFNYDNHVMRLKLGNTTITLRGYPYLERSAISLKTMFQELQREKFGYLVQIKPVEATICNHSPMPEALQGILQQFKDIIQLPSRLPPQRGHGHAIVPKEGTNPINVSPFRYPQAQKDEIERLVGEMLATRIIRPSHSPFSIPMLLVKKKDGSWRFYVGYHALNRVTVPNKFPIPIIEELLDELGGAIVFSKLDLKEGYDQIRVRAAYIPKTAFRTHEGHYEFLVMPFGLTNAPATSQSLMNEVFKPFFRRFVLIFFDDIFIYNKGMNEHREHLATVFTVLQKP